MNSALYQELIDPSKFNLYAAGALVVLIVLCILLVLLVVLKQPNKKLNSVPKGNKSGTGF